MRKKYRWLICILLISLFIGISIFGCIKQEKADVKNLTIGVKSLYYPLETSSRISGISSADHLIFETLVMMDEKFEIQPLLAESWEVIEDGKTYIFHLRKGVKFHDGTPLTAEYVKSSIEYLNEPRIMNAIKEIQVPDDYIVKIELKRPYPMLLHYLHMLGSIFKPTFTEDGKLTNAVGTGPFKLGEYVKGQYYTLLKNKHYWQGEVKIDKVIFREIPDHITRIMALESGEIDMTGTDAASHIPSEYLAELKGNPEFKLSEKLRFRINVLVMNSLKKPLDDIKVRKAICYGINKDAINTVLREGGKVIPGPVSPDSKTFNSAIERYSYDPEKSKQLLVEAGWKDENNDGVIEKDGKPLEITLVTTGTSPEWLRIAEIVQEQLSNLGIDVKIKHLETGAVMKALKTGSFDMAIKVDTGATSIPQDFMTTYHSAPRGGWIAKIIKNSTIDSLISRYNETTDPEKQIELSRKIQQEITNNAPVALYWEDYRIIAMNNKIKNFKPVPGWSSLRNLWKAELGD